MKYWLCVFGFCFLRWHFLISFCFFSFSSPHENTDEELAKNSTEAQNEVEKTKEDIDSDLEKTENPKEDIDSDLEKTENPKEDNDRAAVDDTEEIQIR